MTYLRVDKVFERFTLDTQTLYESADFDVLFVLRDLFVMPKRVLRDVEGLCFDVVGLDYELTLLLAVVVLRVEDVDANLVESQF